MNQSGKPFIYMINLKMTEKEFMKKHGFILIIFFLSYCNYGFCEPDSTKRYAILVDFRVNKMSVNNKKFDKWTTDHQYRSKKPLTGFSPALWVLINKNDFGYQQIVSSPYVISSLFYGRSVIRVKDFKSFLNFDLGRLSSSYDDIVPPNCSAVQGQKMKLVYRALYCGLSSKTIWLKHITDGVALDLGFDLNAGYMPWDGRWRYGYFVPVNNLSSTFSGRYVSSLPALSKFCFSSTVFIGINFNYFSQSNIALKRND